MVIFRMPCMRKNGLFQPSFFFLGWGSMVGPCIDKTVENCILRKQTVAVCDLSCAVNAGNLLELTAAQPVPAASTHSCSNLNYKKDWSWDSEDCYSIHNITSINFAAYFATKERYELRHIHLIMGCTFFTAVIVSGMDLCYGSSIS